MCVCVLCVCMYGELLCVRACVGVNLCVCACACTVCVSMLDEHLSDYICVLTG